MYHEQILEHARKPRNYGILESATVCQHYSNPSCGDVIDVYLEITQGQIVRLAFIGHGCAISQASTSLVLDSVIGKSLTDIMALSNHDVLTLLGIKPGPMRLNCALLPLRALHTALSDQAQIPYLGSH
jgi:nitrogen fixation protein NifU and related proteins